jgi:polysaccharide pyruvyl transferase WcaK-like protein
MEGTGWDAFTLCWAIVMGLATGWALTAIYYRARVEDLSEQVEILGEVILKQGTRTDGGAADA